MIRAVIDPMTSGTAIGGVVMPTNKLEIVTPFAAIAGLIVTVSAVVVAKKIRDWPHFPFLSYSCATSWG
jgi:hypothetical protein